ncbi:hypothetical protein [Methanosarcina sp. 2.H.A.1B.4]|uniref:hypothetical protein n=1 Tax=Methanosarcina sp. 2.H.A.1B.4 TaxID=1483600 RepID=UPI001F19C7B9|nr:hypothetical protein [Methanosarcina sp. 2.H.A.1B.4]
MVPADHIRERVAAVGLGVKRVMTLEKAPVGKSDRFEIFLTKHFKQDSDLALNLFELTKTMYGQLINLQIIKFC